MYILRSLLVLPFALAFTLGSTAQTTLKDGTTLVWDKEITAIDDSLPYESMHAPAYKVPVYEATTSQVNKLLPTLLPGASFKRQGRMMKATGVTFPPASSAPVDILANVTRNKKQGNSTVSLAFLHSGTTTPVENPALQSAVRDIGVRLNKAIVQQQVDKWTKELGKADSKHTRAAKSHDKAQKKLAKTRNQLAKSTQEKVELQNEHAVLQKEVDLYNQKWNISHDPKDLKRVNKARSRITKNGTKLSKVIAREAKAQRELDKSSSNIPGVQQEQDAKAAAHVDMQRTVDALKRKLESIR
ncbi:MAG: hypothetical protein WBB32_01790 [Flavobacteriales bacterium]|nr:hypothetical protein [Flavobacteriales bacterium]